MVTERVEERMPERVEERMPERVCLVHYHEIGLKGRNRSSFERQLVRNVEHALRAEPVREVRRIAGHVLVSLDEEAAGSREAVERVAALVGQVPGVARVSQAFRCELDEEEFCAAAVEAMREALAAWGGGASGAASDAGATLGAVAVAATEAVDAADATPVVGAASRRPTFKVHAKRSATTFPMHSIEMNRLVGGVLCENFPEAKVQMHGPDITVHVLATQARVFVYAASARGVGGLPVGTAGKVVTLLSSGFDSPVATWELGRRGAVCVPVHFSGRPMTSDASEWLTRDIVEALGPEGAIGRLYVVPFGERQREISLAVPQKLRVIMYRRVMVAVACRIAEIEGAKALVTGESLGQVASQTLENIAAVDEMATMPVLRPLIGSDKQEIIERARQIGTEEISSQTAPDCCTLFMPRAPETHAKLDEVHEAWTAFDAEAMIEDLVAHVEYVDFDTCAAYKAPRALRRRHEELEAAW